MIVWDKAKLQARSAAEVRQVRKNALDKGRSDIVALCEEVLKDVPAPVKRTATKRVVKEHGPRLVSRSKAFELRGARLRNRRWSWGGIRESDGTVVLTLWAENQKEDQEGNRFFSLWAPNEHGRRPWADTPGGRERLKHCEMALQQGYAEGVLIYGEQRARELPHDKPSVVHGADPITVVHLRIEKRGDEYLGILDKKPIVNTY